MPLALESTVGANLSHPPLKSAHKLQPPCWSFLRIGNDGPEGQHDVVLGRPGVTVSVSQEKLTVRWSCREVLCSDPRKASERGRNRTGSMRKCKRASGLTMWSGAPDNRISVLYEQVLTPRGNILDPSRYLNSVITAHPKK